MPLIERLAAGEIDDTDDFLTRLDILHLLATREADGLDSFLGGRVRLFPHQLHVAERATLRMPVRWLLADEVGLGKTIEAALIMNRLRPELTTHAVHAGMDLLVVDEAPRLRRPKGHPGEPAYSAIARIAAPGRHVLLLSATPLEDNAHGFFRLLQLLRPDEFPEGIDFDARLASGVPLPPCTSSTRRVDIGGLPPRVPVAVDVGHQGLAESFRLRRGASEEPRLDPLSRRRSLDRIRTSAHRT